MIADERKTGGQGVLVYEEEPDTCLISTEQGEEGKISIWIRRWYLYTKIEGYGHPSFVEKITEANDVIFKNHPFIVTFHDISEMEGYSHEGRDVLFGYVKKNKDRIKRVVIFKKSSMIGMGIIVLFSKISGIKVRHAGTIDVFSSHIEETISEFSLAAK